MNFRHMLREDIALSVKSTENGGNSNEDAPKTYAEYLDAQVKSAQQNKVDFSKADDNKISNLAKDYATIAKNKFTKMEGQPKNDTEANNMLITSIQKNKMDNAADNEGGDEEAIKKAEDEINKAIEELQESIFEQELNLYGKKLFENFEDVSIEHGKVQAAGILLLNPKTGNILVCHPTPIYQLRDGHKGNHTISWGIPKGQIDKGEDIKAAALREFKEETSIELDDDLTYLGKFKYSSDKDINVFLYLTDDEDFFCRNCKCTSTFEKWGKTWDEIDGYAIYNIKYPETNSIHLSHGTQHFITDILNKYPDLLENEE